MKRIVIVGGGGYAKVIAETMDLIDQMEIVGFIDDQLPKGTVIYEELKVLGTTDEIPDVSSQCDAFIIGIGNNEVRKQITERFSGKIEYETLVHPHANVSKTAILSEGVVVLAGASVNSNAEIGRQTIIGSNVVVDHDCKVGEFVHLAIGTLVGSNSVVRSSLKTEIGLVIPEFSSI